VECDVGFVMNGADTAVVCEFRNATGRCVIVPFGVDETGETAKALQIQLQLGKNGNEECDDDASVRLTSNSGNQVAVMRGCVSRAPDRACNAWLQL
jgi:hypothetical protein